MTVESELVSHPIFGDSSEIRRRADLYYSRGIGVIAKYDPSAAKAQDAMVARSHASADDLVGPVIRRAINNGLSSIKDGQNGLSEQDRAAYLAAAERQSCESGPATLISSSPLRSTEGGRTAVDVWDPEGARGTMDSYFQGLFDEEIACSVSSEPVVLREPSTDILGQMKQGEEILGRLVPELWASVSGHVRLVAVLDTSDRSQWNKATRGDVCQNVSTHAIPSTIFLSPSPLRTPWHTAEALLHEASHKKLSDIVLTRSVFRDGFDSEKANLIRALWNRDMSWNSANWSTDRALFAFHVYVHLALFFERAEGTGVECDGFGARPLSFGGERARSLDRATYLGAKLRSDNGDLGRDGKELVSWLSDVLAMFEHEDEVTVTRRLLLDCYDRETREIEDQLNALAQAQLGKASLRDLAQVLDHLVHSEVVAAYRSLTVLGEAEGPSFAHYDGDRWMSEAGSEATIRDKAAVLCSLRRFMSSTLRAAPGDRFLKTYRTRRTKTLLDHLEEMVNHYGRHVEQLELAVRGGE